MSHKRTKFNSQIYEADRSYNITSSNANIFLNLSIASVPSFRKRILSEFYTKELIFIKLIYFTRDFYWPLILLYYNLVRHTGSRFSKNKTQDVILKFLFSNNLLLLTGLK